MSRPKLLWLSDSPLTCTGYATASKNLLNRLSDEWDCHFLAHNYIGQDLPANGITFKDGEKLSFALYGMGREQYGRDRITPLIRSIRPDVFGCLLDTFMVYPWWMTMDFSPARTTFWYPSDGEGGLPAGCDEVLRKMHMPIAMSYFAKEQAERVHGMKTGFIPLACDTSHFVSFSTEKKDALRRRWGLRNKFVVGVVSRNQGRKMLDRVVKAFAKFAKDKNDVVLFLHTDPFDSAAHFSLPFLIQRHGIQNKTLFSGMSYLNGFDYASMPDIYNLMNVFFLGTSGEGFGIPIIEAMSCGIPCVITDYTTTKELLVEGGQCGLPVRLASELTGTWSVERGIWDDDDAAACLQRLYDDTDLREELSINGRKKTVNYYDWKPVTTAWKRVLSNLL